MELRSVLYNMEVVYWWSNMVDFGWRFAWRIVVFFVVVGYVFVVG